MMKNVFLTIVVLAMSFHLSAKPNADQKSVASDQATLLQAFKAICPMTIADMKANIVFQLQANGRSKGPDDIKGKWSIKKDQLIIRNSGGKSYFYTIKFVGASFLINKAAADKNSPSHWIVNSDFN